MSVKAPDDLADADAVATGSANDATVERRVVKKLDRNFLFLLWFLFLLAFLDRSNIGNARVAGMDKDLSLSSDQYQWLLTVFYIFYILAEPLTLMYKVVSPRAWVPVLVLGWGVAATAQAATRSFAGMMVCRALLATFEAGYGPGTIYLLSFFYLRREIGLRIGIFFSAAPLATCFAGALAYAITSGHSRLANWRLLFLVEGIPVLVMSVVTYFAMPSSPQDAWFLDEDEKRVALARGVRQAGKEPRVGRISWKETFSTLLDLKAWITAIMYFSCNVSYASLPVFLPTILEDLAGYSGLNAQGLSAPPYFISFLVTICSTFIADRTQQRGLTVITLALIASAGYVMLAAASTNAVRYAGVYLAALGLFPTIANVLPWVLSNQGSDERRGAGIVLLNLVGQCGPLLGTRLYPKSEAPDYTKGHAICAGFMGFTALLALCLRCLLVWENRKLAQRCPAVEDEEDVQGEENYGPSFRYVL
ncbi:Major facilitator superfamily domain, general substrate transporter [Cordyceps fumosorosea ARSEF 2679]|uniref:Major facilitator superfamily domain, general substrate transporter n=1 Tax=Cordyceps fumosorosea (strain ARSEF 2679) TaxID=1081104 RepID=A0A167I8R5_CORFA|nr:Major facilitator superfamily domain, general substrate transporter [Cordyceps fumosorosea ARSEF 2679]OAA48796.1 Major facilitator superfamily domain, general substrate transporter [Cordyceps fumosorosea ARSEF 2679]